VSVINTATNTVIATIPVGYGPIGVAVSPNGGTVYVTNANEATVSVINTATNTVSATIPVGTAPFGVAVSPNGGTVYVANEVSNTVSVINTATNTVIATIPVGSDPKGFGIFIQGAPSFAGTPGQPDCVGQSHAALNRQYGTIDAAAQALRYSSVQALQGAIGAYCAR
jgi:YVTN family beta-propeller protein